jgi:subtilisin family serine protease
MARYFASRGLARPLALCFLFLMTLVQLAAAAPFDHPWVVGHHDPAVLSADVGRLLTGPAKGGQAALGTDESMPIWVFLTDKGVRSEADYAAARAEATARLTPAARARREVVSRGELVDYLDLPVRTDYVDMVVATGVQLRTVSRWLNAVSVDATPDELPRLTALPMVARLLPVARGRRSPVPDETSPAAVAQVGAVHVLDYGPSQAQLDEIQIPEVHDLGYSGAGIIVCMLDTGYFKVHETFDAIITGGRLVAERDFINGDWETQNEPGDPSSQHNHGTYTWSALGGTSPGELYGPAYGASFAIGKTEDVADEYPLEEDFWQAGSEWADSLGASIISSSLGYTDWYTYEDLDGDTAVTTNAADIAASRNILVATAAGNEGSSSWYYIITPADGDSVVACGAVNSDNELASFSSHGPTYDGRTKPEVLARGVGTHCATSRSPGDYGNVSGTSLSTPLVGGAAALVMEAHPEWSAMQVREALMMTADNAASPDNDRGWGRIRVFDAINYVSVAIAPVAAPELDGRLIVGPNPLALPISIDLDVPQAGRLVLDVYQADGRLVRRLSDGLEAAGRFTLTWDGRDALGQKLGAGVYVMRATGAGWNASTKLTIAR